MPAARIWSKVLRVLLLSGGGMSVMSAVVNIIAAVRLLEPSDEASLGFSRNEVIAWYVPLLLGGLVMLYFGLCRRKDR